MTMECEHASSVPSVALVDRSPSTGDHTGFCRRLARLLGTNDGFG